MEDDKQIFYDRMVEDALRGVVREALRLVAEEGLPGKHYFYIVFRTAHPLAVVPPRLKAQNPEEMTIVLQHQFWNLRLERQWFGIDLSFQGKIETLRVPFEAIVSFADPSAKFMLQFQPESAEKKREEEGEGLRDEDESSGQDENPPPDGNGTRDAKPGPGNVVALDRFRKK